jgi:hypothetical protein
MNGLYRGGTGGTFRYTERASSEDATKTITVLDVAHEVAVMRHPGGVSNIHTSTASREPEDCVTYRKAYGSDKR